MGKLPEAGDALASRFVAVHTALSEGNWSTAGYLELYPLEPVQSTTTSTLLEAQKHKRMVWKSQGYAGYGRAWQPSGKGKGGAPAEKGKKGGGKYQNKGKNKSSSKDSGTAKTGEANPWRDNKEEPGKK